MQEVTGQIVAHLGVTDEATMARIRQIVWDLGRTQAQALCSEALESETLESQGGQALANRFFLLVETKGVKKERTHFVQFSSEQMQAAKLIADQLGEQQATPRYTIARSVRVLGTEAALALLKQTHETEEAGGVMLPDGSRRRTPGGVYFWLIRQQTNAEQQGKIFPYGNPRQSRGNGSSSQPKQARPQPVVPLTWDERGLVLDEAEQERGAIRTVKITVIGRPGKVVERGQCVALSMQQSEKIPSLPAGLPLPPAAQMAETRYSVYIAAKQWRKVSEAIADPEDVLIVEGFPALDAQRGSIAVFASNVTTKKLQIQSRRPKTE